MNDLELTIRLSNEYNASFDRARTSNDKRKCRCWFDRKNILNDAVTVNLTAQGITIRYCTSKGQVQESCTYDSVLSVTEMSEGIMLRLSHKRLLFLPAADNRDDTERVMQAMTMLGSHCKYIFKKSCLRINKAGIFEQIKFRFRPNQGHYEGSGFIIGVLIFLICVVIFMATVFVSMPANNRIILDSEAVSLTATYSGCETLYQKGHSDGNILRINLKFEDHEELTVDGSCSNSGLAKQLDQLPAGTQIHLLVHPESENVLQIDVNGDILLEFNDAQNRIWREAVAFCVLGLFLYIAAAVLSVGIIRKKL